MLSAQINPESTSLSLAYIAVLSKQGAISTQTILNRKHCSRYFIDCLLDRHDRSLMDDNDAVKANYEGVYPLLKITSASPYEPRCTGVVLKLTFKYPIETSTFTLRLM
jgi:hypothetical protein